MRRRPIFKFRLYIAENSQNSRQAVSNLNAICAEHLQDQHEIEVIDVFKQPMRALADAVYLTPTLIKIGPAPTQRIVGNLCQRQTVLNALGLEAMVA